MLLTVVSLLLALVLVGCSGSGSDQSGEHGSGEESRERSTASESGEHSGGPDSSERGAESESGEHGGGSESGEGTEESGTQYTLSETFDHVRAGARLVLSYDPAGNAFTGKVENTTSDKLDRVRVEVHLSNGIELGPTTPVDLAPGQTVEVTLPASSQPFVSWSAHPEVGSSGGSNSESLEHASRPEGDDKEDDHQDRTPSDDRSDDGQDDDRIDDDRDDDDRDDDRDDASDDDPSDDDRSDDDRDNDDRDNDDRDNGQDDDLSDDDRDDDRDDDDRDDDQD